ncbi:uncharacterized protein LODBEIA_P42730 [Lodderomyces beijingensis]|uniref:Exocyst complex component EXO84 n=1 Tax=Lodderomyces beijingensis TaxID=1775926 RepID=A0ABP0ZPH5_9ASCO
MYIRRGLDQQQQEQERHLRLSTRCMGVRMNKIGERRKSRATWQKAEVVNNNPYANNNLTRVETNRSVFNAPERGDSFGAGNGGGGGGGGGFGANPYANINTLQVPGANSEANPNRAQSRRLSIHVAAHQNGRSFSQGGENFDVSRAPPLPDKFVSRPLTIKQKIFQELDQGSAAEIDDYYKTLLKQNQIITRDIKENINQNQKNILELTNDLKETQEELLNMRNTTSELFKVLEEFKETAERRLNLEYEPQHQQQLQSQGNVKNVQNKLKDRSSVLVLENAWAKQIQSLFKNVEGASKFIQPLPGRHVLAESGRWHEVNPGTWKRGNPSHLFVLNDLILIAGKNAASNANGVIDPRNSARKSSKLQALQCWPLTQVSLAQVKPPTEKDSLYFISIKTKSLSFIYQTERYEHLVKITDAFNKGKSEMIHEQRVQRGSISVENRRPLSVNESRDEKRQLRESLRNSGSHETGGIVDEQGKRRSGGGIVSRGGGGGGTIHGSPSKRNSSDFVLDDISARVHSRNRSHDFGTSGGGGGTIKYSGSVNGKSDFFHNIKRLEDSLDDVDIEISHNDYSHAVDLLATIESKLLHFEAVLNKQKNTSVASSAADELLLIDVTKFKISNRKDEIIQCLFFDLSNKVCQLTAQEISRIIKIFDQLDSLEPGIQAYLTSTSLHLSNTVSKLIVGLQGSTKIDVVNYLSNLMVINVAIVKRTIEIYNSKIIPVLRNSSTKRKNTLDSSGLIFWCLEEFTKLCKTIKKHLYGTLLIIDGHNYETDEPVYKIKDAKLYADFLNIMHEQLDELKDVGLDVDFVFESILNLE